MSPGASAARRSLPMIASPRIIIPTDVRDRREERADPEQRGTDDEDPPMAVHVAEAPTDDQQRRERERVTGDHPLDAREIGVEVAQDRRDRDVQDRAVQDDDERAAMITIASVTQRAGSSSGFRGLLPERGRLVSTVAGRTCYLCFGALVPQLLQLREVEGLLRAALASSGRRPSRMMRDVALAQHAAADHRRAQVAVRDAGE